MNITIYGGGNIGTQFAVHCAEKGNCVTVYTTKPEKFSKQLSIVNENGNITHKGIISNATDNAAIAFNNADIVFITVPAFMMENAAETVRPYFRKGMYIALIPGTGGAECCFKDAIEKECIVFGLQRVPSVARLIEYGKIVCAAGYRDTLHLAAIPKNKTKECCSLINELFNISTVALPEYLCVTMTPSNPVLHTSRLRSIFKDYRKDLRYQSIPLFYEEWSLESSELLLKNDQEVQNICKALSMFDLSGVKSLKIHYESETAEQLTNKMRSIKSLRGLLTPSVKSGDGLLPDFSSRYFTADFPYGLEILVQIGSLAKVDIPNLKETLNWYYSLIGECTHFNYSDYGINTLDDFITFYSL